MGWLTEKENIGTVERKLHQVEWIELTGIEQAKELIKSHVNVVFFKHSTRCSISTVALNRFESNFHLTEGKIIPVFLDLLAHRDVSNFLANHFSIRHESPQVLFIHKGNCIYHASHGYISVQEMMLAE